METIGTLPYVSVRFDKNGNALDAVSLPLGTVDLFIISHGWNNDREAAENLYRELFSNFSSVAPPELINRKVAILGVIWPSKKFTELVEAEARSGGAASLGGALPAEATIIAKLDLLEDLFGPDSATVIQQVKELLPSLENSPAVRDEFVAKLLTLVDPSAAHKEDATDRLFRLTGTQILKKLQTPTPLVPGPRSDAGGATMLEGGARDEPAGGAAGLGDAFSGINAGVIRFLNFLTYYEMKARAGTVGKGLGKLIDSLPASVERLHLIGHSFGARVVSAAAMASTTPRLQTMTLLQGAFSHNGFSHNFDDSPTPNPGFFRDVITKHRIQGPILVTYTPNDLAVGILYPAASRLSGTVSSAFGDKNDKFGGIGRNGAQKMKVGEVDDQAVKLLPVSSHYNWQGGKIHNLESSDFIRDPKGGDAHGEVRGREVAWAIATAAT